MTVPKSFVLPIGALLRMTMRWRRNPAGKGGRVGRERFVLLQGDKADCVRMLREKLLGIAGLNDVEGDTVIVGSLLIGWKRGAAPGHGAIRVLGRRDDLEIA